MLGISYSASWDRLNPGVASNIDIMRDKIIVGPINEKIQYTENRIDKSIELQDIKTSLLG